MSEPKIVVDRIAKSYGGVVALQELSFGIEAGEIVCLLGASGCGKSTCLNILAGFERPSAGSARLDGREIAGTGPERSVVFQTDALFPWFDVYTNVILGPRARGMRNYGPRGRALLETVGLSGFEARYPYQLSGGMRQRASIARALINDPEVLLMDEPFGALDAQTRLAMQEHLLLIWQRIRPTILFITHDIDEAIFLGDRVLVMSKRPGRILQQFRIDAAKPRGHGFLTSDGFTRIKHDVLDLLHGSR